MYNAQYKCFLTTFYIKDMIYECHLNALKQVFNARNFPICSPDFIQIYILLVITIDNMLKNLSLIPFISRPDDIQLCNFFLNLPIFIRVSNLKNVTLNGNHTGMSLYERKNIYWKVGRTRGNGIFQRSINFIKTSQLIKNIPIACMLKYASDCSFLFMHQA